MSGEIALDTSVAVRFLNGDTAIIERVLTLPEVILPLVVAGGVLCVVSLILTFSSGMTCSHNSLTDYYSSCEGDRMR
jgi:hypothetical protein